MAETRSRGARTKQAERHRTECALCQQGYRQPRFLPCYHTFCKRCLEYLIASWSQHTKREDGTSVIPCPICKKEATVSDEVDTFEENLYIEGLPETPAARPVKCVQCNWSNLVSTLCIDCNEMYCNDCQERHDNFALAKSHRVENAAPQDSSGYVYTHSAEAGDAGIEEGYDSYEPDSAEAGDPDIVDKFYDSYEPESTDRGEGDYDDVNQDDWLRRLPTASISHHRDEYRIDSRGDESNTSVASVKIVSQKRATDKGTALSPPVLPLPLQLPPQSPPQESPDDDSDLENLDDPTYMNMEEESDESPSTPPPLPPRPAIVPNLAQAGARTYTNDKAQQNVYETSSGTPYFNVQEQNSLYQRAISTSTLDLPQPYDEICMQPKSSPGRNVRLPEPERGKFRFSRRDIHSFCVSKDDEVTMVSLKTRMLRESCNSLEIFSAKGKKLSECSVESSFVSLAQHSRNRFLLAEGSRSFVHDVSGGVPRQRICRSVLEHVDLKCPVLSKPAEGQAIYAVGMSHCDCVIQQVLLERTTLPFLSITHKDEIHAFDASSDGEYFAVVNRKGKLSVGVFQRRTDGTQSTGYQSADEGGNGDACFYTPTDLGREILVVADYSSSRLVMLDHTNRCMVMGVTKMSQHPARLAKDDKGRLWVACELLRKNVKETVIYTISPANSR